MYGITVRLSRQCGDVLYWKCGDEGQLGSTSQVGQVGRLRRMTGIQPSSPQTKIPPREAVAGLEFLDRNFRWLRGPATTGPDSSPQWGWKPDA